MKLQIRVLFLVGAILIGFGLWSDQMSAQAGHETDSVFESVDPRL